MNMKQSVIIKNIASLLATKAHGTVRAGKAQGEVEIIKNAYIITEDDKIKALGTMDEYKAMGVDESKSAVIDATGKLVTPGLVDSHTHLVHGGSRENELSMKLHGKTYMDIMNAGGGIHATQRHTKEASFEELYEKAKKSLDIMLSYGVTTVEAKSGYGIEDFDTELKQLEVVKKLNEDHPIDLVSTFMPCHAMPDEYKNDREAFINKVINEYNPKVMEKGLAEFADIFCEDGVYTIDESRRVLKASRDAGFKLKIHADELISFGGAELSAELKCVSADHLIGASDEGIKAMAANGVVANVLPATAFNLNTGKYARARKMIEEGCPVSISTDYNPGSCPSENIQLAMQIASIKMRMTAEEVFNAATINAAASVLRTESIGSLEVGKKADIAIFNCENIDYFVYHFGINHTYKVIKSGKIVYGA